jgi:hypothetical protein
VAVAAGQHTVRPRVAAIGCVQGPEQVVQHPARQRAVNDSVNYTVMRVCVVHAPSRSLSSLQAMPLSWATATAARARRPCAWRRLCAPC